MNQRTRLIVQALENREVPALFTVVNINDAGAGSLRQAVVDANAMAGADTIQFSALVDTPQIINLTSGELLVTDSVQVTGPANAALVTVSGGGSSRVFNFDGAGTLSVSMSGITIANGKAVDNGGGILVDNESLTLTNVVLNGNSAPTNGGAVFVNVTAGSLTATECKFTNNSAKYGGAIARSWNGSVSLTRCSLTGNNAIIGDGGAIYMNWGSLTVESCLIANNSAGGNGGGVTCADLMGKAYFSNSTFSANTATGNGGGIADTHYGSLMNILNCTIVNNVATDGSGVHAPGIFSSLITGLTITSSIIADNDGGSDLVYAGYWNDTYVLRSLIVSKSGGTYFDNGGNIFGLSPSIGPLANNGGATQTHGLQLNSPAIDAGWNQTPALSFDQRGTGFPRQVGPAVDMGAFETQPPRVGSTLIGDGTSQRSRVTSLAVTFNSPVTLPAIPATAFELKRQSDGALVTLNGTTVGNTVTLTFAGGPVEFGSLADGRYTLTVLASQVSNAFSQLDGNGDGTGGDNYVLIGTPANGLFRIYGDANGDGSVASSDFNQFRLAFGGTSVVFDFDGDGSVSASDFIEFRLRFGGSI